MDDRLLRQDFEVFRSQQRRGNKALFDTFSSRSSSRCHRPAGGSAGARSSSKAYRDAADLAASLAELQKARTRKKRIPPSSSFSCHSVCTAMASQKGTSELSADGCLPQASAALRQERRMARQLLRQAVRKSTAIPPQQQEALQLFEQAYRLRPKDLLVLQQFGSFLCDVGDVDRAEVVLKEAAAIAGEEPEQGNGCDEEGKQVQRKKGRFSEEALIGKLEGKGTESAPTPGDADGDDVYGSEDDNDDIDEDFGCTMLLENSTAGSKEQQSPRMFADVASHLLNLAQLQSGEEALRYFHGGLRALQRQHQQLLRLAASHNGGESSENVVALTGELSGSAAAKAVDFVQHRISSVHCAIAELFMTDLCDREDAEEEVLANTRLALERDESNVEAHHCRAQYLKVIGDIEGAQEAARRAVELIKQYGNSGSEAEESFRCCSIEVRVNVCRTIIDIGEATKAIPILEGCLLENEEEIQAWYVLACAHLTQGNLQASSECISRGRGWIDAGGENTMMEDFEQLRRELKIRLENRHSEGKKGAKKKGEQVMDCD